MTFEENAQDVVDRIFKIKARDPELAETLLRLMFLAVQAIRPDIQINFEHNFEHKLAVRVWQIGPDKTEYYAARSESEMREWYAKLDPETAEEDLLYEFNEVTELDVEFDFLDEGKTIRTTWRKLAEAAKELPCQISSGYL